MKLTTWLSRAFPLERRPAAGGLLSGFLLAVVLWLPLPEAVKIPAWLPPVLLLAALAVLLVLCLIRAVRGPRVADRVVAVNMMGTMTMVMIAILALLLDEGYLVDICIIYAMISFLAVIVLTKVYIGIYLEKKERGKKS